ncbi:MAG: hypothetical protein Q7R57_01940 [Dehalococcoidales bacterium]|nr:hypothetical protein [Dehalococcoidales bacterium]
MPGKSRRARRFTQQAKRPEIQAAPAATPSAAATPVTKPAPKAAQASRTALPHYPFVRTELIRISILTFAIIVILFVLAAVLPRA